MTQLLRRFRGLAIALAVLAISAGAVFAGAPRFVPNGAPVRQRAGRAAGRTGRRRERRGPDERTRTRTRPDEDADGRRGRWPRADAAEASRGRRRRGGHPRGPRVGGRARRETPEGFDNHGAYVSCVAQHPDDRGSRPTSTGVTLEPASRPRTGGPRRRPPSTPSCSAADAGRAQGRPRRRQAAGRRARGEAQGRERRRRGATSPPRPRPRRADRPRRDAARVAARPPRGRPHATTAALAQLGGMES